jgi:hypothetical protein
LELYNAGFTAAQITSNSGSETQLRFASNTAARISNQANTSLIFDTNATERMRILNDGKVGIGTTPENPLTIQDIGGSTFNRDFAIRNGDATNYHRLILGYNAASAASGVPTNAQFILAEKGGGYGTSAGLVVGNSDNAPVMFTTNAAERMRIVAGGNVGIGTNNPSYGLHVKGSFGIQGADDANEGGQIDFVGGTSYTGYGKQIDIYQQDLRFFGANSWSASFFSTTGGQTASLSISGALSKGSGSFKIDHPLESKKDTHHLVHSFIEGPQADLIYRGKVDLVGGTATINIDTAANITDGTFVLLNREVQCFTTNETGWTAIKGSVSGNILTITAQDNTCTDTISWMVIGERKDPHMYGIDWTDSDGKVITEPLKPEE